MTSISQQTEENLRNKLQVIQKRLGTELEQEKDFADAQFIAHELNNLRTSENLVNAIYDLGER